MSRTPISPLSNSFSRTSDECLGPLHVAGIAYPDAELPEELARLARRAEELGLSGANGHLARLALHLELVTNATQRSHRENAAMLVWNELQHLLTWLRLLRVEYGLMAAERTLLRGVDGTIQTGTPRR